MEQPTTKKLKSQSLRERYNWLEEKDGKYYCKYCSINPTLLRYLRENAKDEYFVNKGVPKNADPGRKGEVHDKLISHSQAVDFDRVVSGQQKSVIDMIRDKALFDLATKEKTYDIFIKKYMKIALWLFESEIPHTGNFSSLIDLVSTFSEELCHFAQTRDSNATYRSTTTCTEFMELMASVLDEEAVLELKKSISTFSSWALMADETSIHGIHMLGVYARYIECESGQVVEEMIDCCPIKSVKAEALFEVIDECLRRRSISTETLRCVSFDGAAAMSSRKNGLYGHMISRWGLPHLVFQHCRAHRLQLVGRDAANDCPQVQLALGTAQTLYAFFHKSNKKLELLRKMSTLDPEFDGYMRKLIEVAPTRWLSYSQAIGRLLRIYATITLTLDSIMLNVEFTPDDRAKATGLLTSMLSREMLATLIFMDIILGQLASLSCIFQGAQATLETAIKTTRATMSEIARFSKKDQVLKE